MMNVIHVVMDNIKMHRVTSKQVAKVTALKDLTFRRTKSRAKFVLLDSLLMPTTNKLASIAAKVNTPKVRVLGAAQVVPTVNTTIKIKIAFTRVPFVRLGNNSLTEINVKTAQLARFNHY